MFFVYISCKSIGKHEMFTEKNPLNGNSVLFNPRQNGASMGRKFQKRFSPDHDITSDCTLRAVVILTAVFLLIYKISNVIMSYITTEYVEEVSTNVKRYTQDVWNWINVSENQERLLPIICGLGFAVFSYLLVYLDSNIPGIDPPSPFSPKSKRMYRNQKASSMHLGYIIAIASGVVVGALMFYKF